MFARLNKGALLLITVGCLWEQTSFAQARPPLLQALENLLCATDSASAKQQLDKLFNISPPGQQWPDEWLGTQANQASLQAGTLDLALLTLQQTALRFPSLRETAEQVALQWDYCEVLEEEQFYNLSWQAQRLSKTLAAEPASKWAGFRQWGFLSSDPADRFVPVLLDEIRIAPNAYHLLLHRIYRQQCFPHPETGLLAREVATPNPAYIRAAVAVVPQQKPIPYPFVWQPICVGKARKTLQEAAPVTKLTQQAVTTQQAVNQSVPKATQVSATDKRLVIPIDLVILEPNTNTKNAGSKAKTKTKITALNTKLKTSQPNTTTHAKATTKTTTKVVLPTKGFQSKGQGAQGKAGERPTQKKMPVRKKKTKSARKRLLATQKKPAVTRPQGKPARSALVKLNKAAQQKPSQPINPRLQSKSLPAPPEAVLPAIIEPQAGGRIPLYLEPDNIPKPQTKTKAKAKTQAHGMTGIIEAKSQKNWRLAGSLGGSFSLKEGSHTLSASATWSPQANWFIGGNVSLKASQVSYAWSAGYADYKPGGWSAQLNNWGPIQPGQGLALDKASLNLGHKFKSIPLAKYKLTASSNLSVPVKGRPSLSGSLQWNPNPNWYARTTASVPLKGGDLNWHYAFGYNNPSILGKWKLEYSNYGTNAFPGDNLKDGTLSVTRSW